MQALRIAIVGYGTAGQSAAVLLGRDGHEVDVFERVREPGPVGAGFLLQPSGLQVLWRMGLLDRVLRYGVPVARLYGDTPGGRAVMDMRYAQLDPRLAGIGLQRGALFSILAEAWPQRSTRLHADREIAGIDAEHGLLRDVHGERHGPYDLVVVADGAASRLRAGVARARIDRPYPWGALWCLLPIGEWPLVDELRQRYVSARKMIGLLPVGSRPGDDIRRLSFFWSLPADGFEAFESAGLETWHQELRGLWPEAWPVTSAISEVGQLARARYRDAVHRQWYRGRVVMIGDAVHAMSPQLGQGVNMALLDAQALARTLASSGRLEAALADYQRERRQHVWIYQWWSRWLTPLFQSDRDFAARLRDAMFMPMGRLPVSRGQMLRVLTGTRQGVFGRFPLEPGFLEAMSRALPAPGAGITRPAQS